jgi:hypothetical protein
VARNSRAAWKRAPTRLYSCTRCFNPPSRKDAPSMKSVLATIAPAMDAFTRMYCPARRAVSAITSSVRLPSVAFRRPPTASPVFAATDSVAWLSRAASGTMARMDSRKSSVGASDASVSAAKTTGTKSSSHSNGLWRISFSKVTFQLTLRARGRGSPRGCVEYRPCHVRSSRGRETVPVRSWRRHVRPSRSRRHREQHWLRWSA